MFDHFCAGRTISEKLAQEQFGDISELLVDSLSCGSATEALMGMRWHLSRFLETNPELTNPARDAIDELLKDIEVSLL